MADILVILAIAVMVGAAMSYIRKQKKTWSYLYWMLACRSMCQKTAGWLRHKYEIKNFVGPLHFLTFVRKCGGFFVI